MANWALVSGSESRNEIDYKPNATVRGVCMGASALWCSYAKKGKFNIKPIDHSHIDRAKKLTKYFVEDTNQSSSLLDRLNDLLGEAQILGLKVPNLGGDLAPLLKEMIKTPGVYLICVGTHVMGVSSLANHRYFYDIENGLYSYHDLNGLKAAIVKLRDGEDTVNDAAYPGMGWRGLRCVGIKCF